MGDDDNVDNDDSVGDNGNVGDDTRIPFHKDDIRTPFRTSLLHLEAYFHLLFFEMDGLLIFMLCPHLVNELIFTQNG
jgi:hypothetical protein